MNPIARAAFLCLLAAVAAHAQVRESMTVEVVEVPVYITTSDGQPIRGLSRDAFQLFVDGKAQPIEYFDAVDFTTTSAAAPAQVAQARPLRERRLYLLLFDLSFASPAKVLRAQRAAEQALQHANHDTDYFAVATYSAQHGAQFQSAFLRDQAAVLRALYTLHGGKINDPLGVAISSAERATWASAGEKGVAVAAEQENFADMLEGEMADAIRGGQANQEALRQPAQRLIEFQVGNLADTAARLAALEGQKHVLFFTEGFKSTRVTDITVKQGPPQSDDRLLRFVRQMHDTFASAGVMLDTIDVAGLRHTFDSLENDALYMLTRGTGGRVVVNRSDLVEAVNTVTTAQSVVYILGFHPRDRRQGRISVKVSGVPRTAEVSYREGFGFAKAGGDGDALQLADVLTNDLPQSGLRIATKFEPRPGGAELQFALFPEEIVPQLVNKTPYVDALIYVFDAKGATIMAKSERINFDGRLRESKAPVILRGKLNAPPGGYVVKAVAHIAGTQSLGFVKRDLEVAP
jgi:VWFA-related protein